MLWLGTRVLKCVIAPLQGGGLPDDVDAGTTAMNEAKGVLEAKPLPALQP